MTTDREPEPTITIGLEMKINLGNYESAGVTIRLHGLHAGSQQEEIDDLLNTGKLAYDRMRISLATKLSEIKRGTT